MSNLSETAKISCHYEPFTTAGAIFRETDRTNLYSQYIKVKVIRAESPIVDIFHINYLSNVFGNFGCSIVILLLYYCYIIIILSTILMMMPFYVLLSEQKFKYLSDVVSFLKYTTYVVF